MSDNNRNLDDILGMLTGFDTQFSTEHLEDVVQEIETRGRRNQYYNFGGTTGAWRLWILPPGNASMMARGMLGARIWKHWIKINGERVGVTINVARTMPDQFSSDPVEQALQQLEARGIPPKVLEQMRPRATCYFNAIVLEEPERTKDALIKDPEMPLADRLVVLEGPTMLYDWIHKTMADPKCGLFANPMRGTSIVVERSGSDLQTKYNFSLYSRDRDSWGPIKNPDGSKINQEQLAEIAERLADLGELLKDTSKQQELRTSVAAKLLAWGNGSLVGGGGVISGSLEEAAARAFGGAAAPAVRQPGPPIQQQVQQPTFTQPMMTPEQQMMAAQQAMLAQQAAQNVAVQPPPSNPQPAFQPAPTLAPAQPVSPATGAVAGPQRDPSGTPVCFGKVSERNPGAYQGPGSINLGAVVHPECVACQQKELCSYMVPQ